MGVGVGDDDGGDKMNCGFCEIGIRRGLLVTSAKADMFFGFTLSFCKRKTAFFWKKKIKQKNRQRPGDRVMQLSLSCSGNYLNRKKWS